MSAFKQFLVSDIIVTPFEVNKSFNFEGSAALTGSDVGINRLKGQNAQGLFNLADPTTGQTITEYTRLVYASIKELYYSNYLSSSYGDSVARPEIYPGSTPEGNTLIGSASSAGHYENYLQTTLTYKRYFPTGSDAVIGVVSIPSKLYGDKIQPGSFRLISNSGSLEDNGEGYLTTAAGTVCGILNYQHGLAIITGDGSSGTGYGFSLYGSGIYGATDEDTLFTLNFIESSNITCSFSSSYTFYETQYKCTINTSEFNFTLNPSTLSGSSEGSIYNFLTGSYFNPYVTTVGLYNENQELLAVGKLAQPLGTNNTTDTTILINIDR